MAKLLRLRRGTDTQHTTFTGAEGEVTVNTTNDSLHVHDGTTAGGRELLRTDLSNLPAGTIDNADINNSAAIANSKLATSGVTAGTYGSSSAIPAITVNDRGIVTSATTSAIDSTSISNGTSNVSVAASGDITVTQGGTTVGTFTGNSLDFNDNISLRLGNAQDLRLYHDQNNSYIEDAGTGSLIVRATNLQINNAGNTQNYISATDGGSAVFYHAGNAKLSTESTGINVTGIAQADEFRNDGVFYVNSNTVSSSYSVPSNNNAMSAGPITVPSGVTVTVPAGSAWTVV